ITPSDIQPNTTFGLRVAVKYASGDGKAQDFDLDLRVISGDKSLWTLRDEDTGTPLPKSTTEDVYTLRVTGVPADESPATARIRITSPTRDPAADRSLTLGLSIRSVDLTPAITARYAQQITLVVKQG